VKNRYFWLSTAAVVIVAFAASRLVSNDYFFFAGYVVLQYIVLATAWNILGGYTGYINFGTSGFFAIGAYTAVVLHKLWAPPIPVSIVLGGVLAGAVGLGMGCLTLRLKGVFFAIGTLALAIVVQTFITNWDFVGGSRGVYIIRPASAPYLGSYIHYLFLVMLILSGIAVAVARTIEHSTLGYGLAAIRDDEQAAEASGVPTLRLKLISTTLSGALMGMAGAPLPYYVTYLDPSSGFNLAYAVNAIAMPLIGGTTMWLGPVLGAILLGVIQQAATVMISSSLNLLFVGELLVVFVVIAPYGLIGLFKGLRWQPAKYACILVGGYVAVEICGYLLPAVSDKGVAIVVSLHEFVLGGVAGWALFTLLQRYTRGVNLPADREAVRDG
jgi:branched-chain amino acid transport system permease protein